ncbi:MAG: S-methyl-5-thioribose-1-phosphate isomerase [Candidatus Bathyarchaeota archaeon]|nr:MAG: S-methyl-5-thioribose-1-phosphate isomerase [Candidatus Bathyarchaeota archaeon]
MLNPVLKAANRIRKLEVQGARNVAITAIQAVEALVGKTKARNKEDLLEELSKAKHLLFTSRETEPLMRNGVRWIINQVERSREEGIMKLVEIVSWSSRRFLESLEDAKDKIAEIGARRVGNDHTILTHCHSSTVTHLLRKAKQEGRDFEVICTETRPFFQGRITAKEMLDLGIKTTLIVDSAARFFMNQVNFVIVGADAITSEGNVINKIGTSMIALAAQEARTPFYVVSELLKFDPATMYGDYERIEERDAAEIWENAPKNIAIRNPAFDVTRRDFIHGIICEEGIISPHSIIEVMRRKHPWVFR